MKNNPKITGTIKLYASFNGDTLEDKHIAATCIAQAKKYLKVDEDFKGHVYLVSATKFSPSSDYHLPV